MRLKKLELFGFKSFADKTEVIFDEGVTCIVGPNGCGKSNISDSIRWVLGERSAKILRGSKMEDVIFNGTDFRKPIAFAEVSLTIDNSDRGLPIEYNEVTITRRLFRSGESEYLLNKTTCRLKDIQDLILDTGIGSNSYSMIEQGRIDYILNANAEERRFLIEEAAGISKFKVKKEEAIRKLEKTEENRLRLNDIIHEVQKNIAYAERQAQKAEKYKVELEKLKKLEITKAFWELERLSKEKEALEASRNQVMEEISKVRDAIQSAKLEQDNLTQTLKEIETRLYSEESKRFGLQSKFDQNEQQLRFNQEKRLQMAEQRGQIDSENEQIKSRLVDAEAELAQKQAELETLLSDKAIASSVLAESQVSLQGIEQEIATNKASIEQIKSQVIQASAGAVTLRNEFHRLQAFIDSCTEQKKKQEAGAARLRQETEGWKSKQQLTQEEYEKLGQNLESLDLRKQQIIMDNVAAQEDLSKKEEALEQMRRDLYDRETRLSVLLEIDSASRSTEEAVLSNLAEEERDFTKSLRELLSAQPGYEWALEAALGSFARSMIVENIMTAEKLIQVMKTQKSSEMGLLIREKFSSPSGYVQKPEHSQITLALRDVVQVKAGYEDVFHNFFSNVFLVESFETEKSLPSLLPIAEKHILVTSDGLVLGPNAKVYFHNPSMTSEDNLFKRGTEINVLKSEISELSQAIAVQKFNIEAAERNLRDLVATKESIEASHLDNVIQKESYESLLKGMEERIGSYQKELELTGFEFFELQNQYEASLTQKTQLESRLADAERFEVEIKSQQESLLRRHEVIEADRSEKVKLFLESKAKFESSEEKIGFNQTSVELLRQHCETDKTRMARLVDELQRVASREVEINEQDKQIIANQEVIVNQIRESEVALELIRQEKTGVDSGLESLRAQQQNFIDNEKQLETQLHQFEMKKMDIAYQDKNVHERLEQTYKLSLVAFNAADFPVEEIKIESIEEDLAHLKKKVESLGTVNLLAIEEYEELKQRFDFLMAQNKDLEDAKEQLMETIRKINRTTKGLFEETFNNVQKTFQEYYTTLFRGGQAKLVLVDETNPLESGIDIQVRPPGKKPQHISLLSGGEKALTAIALLFALFKIKPSPFCVLDEVDAPLDEANVDRFLNVLKSFLTTSQFIIVTHNRKTISMGDSLYGVTMQEAGVSKLVSVKVNPQKGPEPVVASEPTAENEEKDKTEEPTVSA